jgi:hypothetical protein
MSMRHCKCYDTQYSKHLMDARLYWDLNVFFKYGYLEEVMEDLAVNNQALLLPTNLPSLTHSVPPSLTDNVTAYTIMLDIPSDFHMLEKSLSTLKRLISYSCSKMTQEILIIT